MAPKTPTSPEDRVRQQKATLLVRICHNQRFHAEQRKMNLEECYRKTAEKFLKEKK